MTEKYDVILTDSSGESVGFVCDWNQGGVGLKVERGDSLDSGRLATKGEYGVKDVNDFARIIQTDWVQGTGQKTYDREDDSESAFEDSRYIDVGTKGEFKLAPHSEMAKIATVVPVITAGLVDATPDPLLWMGDTAAKYLKYSADGITWSAPAADTYDHTGIPTSLCTDGAYVYGCFNGVVTKSTIADTATYSADASNANLTHCAFATGVLYAAKSSTDQLGSFVGGVWSALTPASGGSINLDAGTTFGLVSSGNFVYWGTTNGTVTKVYKAQYVDGAQDVFQAVATFPTGFVGASLYAYLGTIYVGGHFDGETTATGIGAIYAIVDDTPVLLTDVGTDKTADNRVISMSAYERDLYFISNSHIWRWDLVNGGYSHWTGPLNPIPTLAYSGINWTGEWAMDAAPGDGAEPDATVTTEGTTSAHIVGSTLQMTLDNSGTCSRKYTTTAAVTGFAETTGITLEVEVPANFIDDHGHYTSFTTGINGDLRRAAIDIYASPASTSVYQMRLSDGESLYKGATIPAGSAHSLRLTLFNDASMPSGSSLARVYVDGIEVLSGYSSAAPSTPETVWIQGSNGTGSGTADDHVTVGNARWTDDGAFAPGTSLSTTVTGAQIACWRDKVAAACSGVGVTRTSTTTYKVTNAGENEAPPYLLASRSSGNMPTVDKYFHAIHVSTENQIPENCTLTVSGTIDGQGFTADEDTDLSSDTMRVFPLGINGRNIQYQVNVTALSQTGTLKFSGVVATSKIYIDGILFTAHATTTTVANREFSIAGTDSEDADEFVDCVNDATYGVSGVTATNDSGTITLVSTNDEGLSLSEGLTHVDSSLLGVVTTPVITEVAVLFRPTPKTTRVYSYYLRVWDNVTGPTGVEWDVNADIACDFLEDAAFTVVGVERASGDDFSGYVESLQFVEAPPGGSQHRQGIWRVDIRRLT